MAAQGARPRGQTRKTQAERGFHRPRITPRPTDYKSAGYWASPRPRIKPQHGKILRPKATPSGAARGDCVDRCQLPREGALGSCCRGSAWRKYLSAEKILLTTWILSIHGSLARELPAVVADTAKAEGVALNTQQFPHVAHAPAAKLAKRRRSGGSHRPRIKPQHGKSLRPKATPSGAARGDCVDRCQLPHEGAWGRTAGVARKNKAFRPKDFPNYMDILHTRLPREGAAEG